MRIGRYRLLAFPIPSDTERAFHAAERSYLTHNTRHAASSFQSGGFLSHSSLYWPTPRRYRAKLNSMKKKRKLGDTVTPYWRLLDSKSKLEGVDYVKVPKHLLIDPYLTPKEKIVWMTLACYQFKPDSQIFPGRERIAALIGIKSKNGVSKLTRTLQEGAYLIKAHDSRRRTFYKLYFHTDTPVDDFFGYVQGNSPLKLHKRNRIRGTTPPSEGSKL